MFQLSVTSLFTAAFAAIFFVIGATLRRRVSFLLRFCIPAAVLGGLLASLIVLFLHVFADIRVDFDMAFQYPMMLAFFATLGIGGSLKLIRLGGPLMIIYLLACWGVSLLQNILGVVLACFLGVNPLIGIMTGAVSLSGGHATAAAFGPMAETLGASGAKASALAAATYGLIAGGLLGGPTAARLIKRHGLARAAVRRRSAIKPRNNDEALPKGIDSFRLFQTAALVAVLMALGDWAASGLNFFANCTLGWSRFYVPGYVGSMFAAVVFRNLNDLTGFIKLDDGALGLIADISLGFFLTMGMMNLHIWDLWGLGVPLAAMLAAQTAAVVAVAAFVLFPLLGGGYDAAVMCAGFVGHGMGAAPNAISNMNSVCDRFGAQSDRAFLIVPLCSAFLVDLFAVPNILWFISFFGR